MSGGYKTPAKDDADAVKRKIESHSDAIDILQRPSAAQLTQLVKNLIVPQVGSASTTIYTLTTSYQAICTFNFTVPAGCTRALCSASGAVAILSAVSGGGVDYGYTAIQINGISGAETIAIEDAPYAPAVPAFAAASLTGLTAGALIPVTIFCHLKFGPGYAPNPLVFPAATVTGTALFLP